MGKLFYVRQTIICINDNFDWSRKRHSYSISYPTFAQRYTVRAYVMGGKYPAVVLEEINNPRVIYTDGIMREAAFWDRRFVSAPPPIEKTTTTEREKETV